MIGMSPLPHRWLPLVAIPTSHRPNDVSALLASLDAAVDPADAPAEVIVIDDSDDDRAPATRAAASTPFARLRVEYVSFRERQTWARARARAAGLDEPLCLSLLASSTRIATNVGAARNYALLRAKGHGVLFLDDDVRCSVVVTGDPSATRFTGLEEPVETQCFERFADAAAGFRFAACDLRTLHAGALGAVIAASDSTRPVRLVMLGYAGRSGMGSPAFYLLTKGPVRQRLINDAGAYERILATNLVMRGAPCVTYASPAALTMAGCLSVDCGTVMPPFLPTGRNQDGFFGGLVAEVHPQALMTHLPFAVQHGALLAQAAVPGLGRADVRSMGRTSQLASVFLAFLPSNSSSEAEPKARLRAIGKSFAAFDHWPNGTFEQRLRDVRTASLTNWAHVFDAAATRLPRHFAAHDDAAHLAAYLRTQVGSLPVVDEVPESQLRGALSRTGRQLQLWADLWDAV